MRQSLCIILVVSALTACETDGDEDWGEWLPVAGDESLIAFNDATAAPSPVMIRRQRRDQHTGASQEEWRWPTGSAFISKLPNNRYYPFDPRSQSIVVEEYGKFIYLNDIGLTLSVDDVRTASNKLGVFHYVVSDDNTADAICFVYFQGMRSMAGPNYEDAIGGAGGLLGGFDCRDKSAISTAELRTSMLRFVESIGPQ